MTGAERASCEFPPRAAVLGQQRGGPMHMGPIHPMDRDCSPAPAISTLDEYPWITKK